MIDLECPTCNHVIRIKTDPFKGQYVSCPNCRGVFSMISVRPPILEQLKIDVTQTDEIEFKEKQKNSKSHHYPKATEYDEDYDRFEARKRAGKAKKRNRFLERE